MSKLWSSVALLVGLGAAACQAAVDERPCQVLERPLDLYVALEDAFPELPSFERPATLAQVPGDGTRMFVVEEAGLIKGFRIDDPGSELFVVADLSDRVTTFSECGLLSVAFHPQFADNAQVFVSYCLYGDPPILRYARFRYDTRRDALDLESEQVLFEITSPRASHQSGQIHFSPDGLLVTSVGDTGPQGDTEGHAQDPHDLPGSFLRIDVDRGEPYAIPPSNPFAEGGELAGMGAPEVYAWGFRNPWSFSFDRETGALWAGDVGHRKIEEVNVVELGRNYGWPVLEGLECYVAPCEANGFTPPVATFDNGGTSAIIGGYVYRGQAIPSLQGVYLYTDFSGGALYGLFDPYSAPYARVIFPATGMKPSSFHEDPDGELYITDIGSGRIHKLVPSEWRVMDDFPRTLSASGCVRFGVDGKPEPAGGAIPYELHMPLWSDGADKLRYMHAGEQPARLDRRGDLQFAVGTVLVKLFELEGELVEGRLLVRHADGAWGGYSYEWNRALNDGVLLEQGKTKRVGAASWTFPSREDCFGCHTEVAGSALGPELDQLGAEQARSLSAHDILEAPRSDRDSPLQLAGRDDDSDLDHWVRSYLQVNCAGCHQPGGPSESEMDLRYVLEASGTTLAFADMHLCGVPPIEDVYALERPALLQPGDPASSLLYLRMADRGENGMPPIGSALVDELALKRVALWIKTIDACP